MIDPQEADIGRAVIYVPPGEYPGKQSWEGVISSFNDSYVFVLFGSSPTAVACARGTLEWAFEEPPRPIIWKDDGPEVTGQTYYRVAFSMPDGDVEIRLTGALADLAEKNVKLSRSHSDMVKVSAALLVIFTAMARIASAEPSR